MSDGYTNFDIDALIAEGVNLAITYFLDNAGIMRAKTTPLAKLSSAIRNGLGASYTFGVFTGNDQIAESRSYGSRIGDLRLIPDISAARRIDDIVVIPGDQYDQEGAAWPLCPRGVLQRMTAKAAGMGFTLKMASELEFFLGVDDGAPIEQAPAYGIDTLLTCRDYISDLLETLSSAEIEANPFHTEYAPGHVEFALSPKSPIEAADDAAIARAGAVLVGAKHGFKTSFSPVVSPEGAGNGRHVHFSLWREERNLFGIGEDANSGMTKEAQSFLAGVLAELPALVAIGCASPASAIRLKPDAWTGAFTCWGTENREAAIRFIRGSKSARPNGANAEIKCLDSSGNPYLVAGAIIAAGLAGLEQQLDLPEEVLCDPGLLSAAERQSKGVLPLSAELNQGADNLEASAVMRSALGDHLVEAITAVRRHEADTTKEMSAEQICEFYRWRY